QALVPGCGLQPLARASTLNLQSPPVVGSIDGLKLSAVSLACALFEQVAQVSEQVAECPSALAGRSGPPAASRRCVVACDIGCGIRSGARHSSGAGGFPLQNS